MNPKPAHQTAAETLADLVNPYGLGEFTTATGIDWEYLAAALDGHDHTDQAGRDIATAWDPTTRGQMRFAADLGLNRWGIDGWTPTMGVAACDALEDATRTRRPAGVTNTINGRVSPGAFVIQARDVTGTITL